MAISLEAGENALSPRSSAEKVDRPNVSKWGYSALYQTNQVTWYLHYISILFRELSRDCLRTVTWSPELHTFETCSTIGVE